MLGKAFFLFIATIGCHASYVNALEDGDFYKIIHSSSGKVLTVGSNGPVDGAAVILSDWKNEPNQKWLAVQAVVAGDNYLLLTQQQRWNWNHFLRNGEALRETKERHDSLPDWSLVLNGNSRGEVTVKPRDSKKYQQWRSEVVTSGFGNTKVIIKNLQENKCLQNGNSSSQTSGPIETTTPRPGLFRRVRNWFGRLFSSSSASTTTTLPPTTPTTPTPTFGSGSRNPQTNKIALAPCDKSSSNQQWTLELVSVR